MAAIARVHALFRPLIKQYKISLIQVNSLHIAHNYTKLPNISSNKLLLKHYAVSCTPLRFESTHSSNDSHQDINKTDFTSELQSLPEPPQIPETGLLQDSLVSAPLAENVTTLASQGLGGYWPPGLAQQYIDFLHTGLDLPWWAAICTGTLIIRICLFPLVVKSQRHAANMANHMPQMQLLQYKMTEARKSGNPMETSEYANELMQFMKEKNLNPLKGLMLPLAQAPIFLAFFFGLKRMAYLPMESMKDGGILWFSDLTLADPYFILPIFTSATLYLTIHFGVDAVPTSSNQMMHYFLRAMPLVCLPFMIYFPTAVLCYWASSNCISLCQVLLLKIPSVRQKFDLPMKIPHKPLDIGVKKKGFVEGFKETFTNARITSELEDRRRLDEEQFRRAGAGPIPKTYTYNPTKQSRNAIIAKKKDK